MMRSRQSTLLACALALAACKPASFTAPAPGEIPPPKPVAANPAMPNDNLNAVLWMQDSAEYGAVCETIYRAATAQLDAALADTGRDALVPAERDKPVTGLPPAVVMDVDETVLDNSPYQARLIAGGKEFESASWDAWVAEKRAQPLPGVVEFAQAATARGITVLYVSNRREHLQAATIANLRAVGLPVKDDSVFLGLGTVVPGCTQQGTEKDCRRRLAGREYRVLMQFGDQLGDFVQVPVNTPKDRGQLAGMYRDWFGQRWWMLPNPSYGHWEPAVFGNDWTQPLAKRRAAKHAALDLAR